MGERFEDYSDNEKALGLQLETEKADIKIVSVWMITEI